MSDTNSGLAFNRREYDTWESAFAGLAPVIRQQSVRVASYSQVIFLQACEDGFGKKNKDMALQMDAGYTDLAYKCGLYHQIGKSLVPPEYQVYNKDFSSEEMAVYRKYTSDGRKLAAHLQDVTENKKRLFRSEARTDNIPFLMIREACEQHMERWNGSGYPTGKRGDSISPIGQIVGLAKEFDRLVSERKSEEPFDETFAELNAQSGKEFSPELIAVLNHCRAKCKAIYCKYIHYTLTLPKTVPLVDKRKSRPLGLSYRGILSGGVLSNGQDEITGYLAEPWFGGLLDNPDEKEDVYKIDEMLGRTECVSQIAGYLLYEVCDTVLHFQNCRLPFEAIILRMLPSFYNAKLSAKQFEELFKNQPIDRKNLMLTVPAGVIAKAGKGTVEAIARFNKNCLKLVIDNYDSEIISVTDVVNCGIEAVIYSPEASKRNDIADITSELKVHGITAYADGIETHEELNALHDVGVSRFFGMISGHTADEDSIIRDALVRERIEA